MTVLLAQQCVFTCTGLSSLHPAGHVWFAPVWLCPDNTTQVSETVNTVASAPDDGACGSPVNTLQGGFRGSS